MDNPLGKRAFLHNTLGQIVATYQDKLNQDKLNQDKLGQDKPTQGRIRLSEATLLEYLALGGRSYGVHVKLEQDHQDDGYIVNAGTAYGKAWQVGQGRCYGLGAMAAQAGKINNGHRAVVGVRAGCIHPIGQRMRVWGEVNVPLWSYRNAVHPKWVLSAQYDINSVFGMRANVRHSRYTQGSFGVVWYVD